MRTSAIISDKKRNVALDHGRSSILSRHHSTDDKCSITDFTNKRREMLMLNMSIDTQQERAHRLYTNLEKKRRDFEEREAGLGESMQRFDCFLKELDQEAQRAAKALAEQLQKKSDKEKTVRDLLSQIELVKSELRQHTADIEDAALV